jgi:hypothetical protein
MSDGVVGTACGRTNDSRRHGGRTNGGRSGRRTTRRRWAAGVAAAALVVSGVAGCAGGEAPERKDTVATTAQAPAAAKPSRTHADVCAEARSARKSLDSLLRRDFSGISGAQAAIVQLQGDLRDLQGSASGELKRQTTALAAQVSDLRKAVARLGGGQSGADTLTAVRSSAEKVAASAGNMRRSLATACPNTDRHGSHMPRNR